MKRVVFALISLSLVGASAVLTRGGAHGLTNRPAASVSFAKAITLNSPVLFPYSIAAGDLTHNGIPDLTVVGVETPALFHALGKGNGHFGRWSNKGGTGDAPGFVVMADVDLDGNLDAVTTDGDQPFVTVAFGDGKGHFNRGVQPHTGKGFATQQVAVADLNGDGIPDLVGTSFGLPNNPGGIFILLGKGNRKFAKAVNIGSGGHQPVGIAVGDLNHDGIPDLVVANWGQDAGPYGNLAVLLGKGDGTFNSYVPYKVGSRPFSIAAADFTGNGIIDLVVANENSANVSVLLGNGDGTFQEPPVTSAAGSTPVWVSVGNFKAYGSSSPGTLLKPGCAYQTTYSWLVGNTLAAKSCAAKGSVWTCDVNGPKGYQAQAVWDTSQSCSNGVCTFSKYTFNPKFIQYETVYGQVVQVNGSTVPIGYQPILLENQNPSRTQTSCPGEWLGVP